MTPARNPLVREIEAPAGTMQSPSDVHAVITRKYIRESPFWPRIRAALEAAEDVVRYTDARLADGLPLEYAVIDRAIQRYRAATRTERPK